MNGDSTWGVAVAFDGDAPDVAGQGIGAHSFCPLDHDDGQFVTQQIVEVDGVCGAGAFVETIKIDVVELQTSGVRVYKSERRTGDVFFVDSQRGAHAFHEERLARA